MSHVDDRIDLLAGPPNFAAQFFAGDRVSLKVVARKRTPRFVDHGVDRDTLCRRERPRTETAHDPELLLEARGEVGHDFRWAMALLHAC
jgi:hypothetical protein